MVAFISVPLKDVSWLHQDSVSLNNTMPGCASVWFRKHTSSLITQIQDVINYRCMEITVASYRIYVSTSVNQLSNLENNFCM